MNSHIRPQTIKASGRRMRLFVLSGGIAAMMLTSTGRAQLRETEVVIVYDSRIADSVAVAEYYAGSARITGATGAFAGIRQRVRVLNLQAIGGGFASATAQIDAATFKAQLRNPIRTWLTNNGLFTTSARRGVRCLVLTKGLPHRILDQNFNFGLLGDNPGGINTSNIGSLTYASVDSELTLLMQNLDTGEAGGPADSFADGMLPSPFAESELPMNAYGPGSPSTPKSWSPFPVDFGGGPTAGFVWGLTSGSGASAATPGDVMLVTRLDGNTVPGVRAMIDRAQNLQVNTTTANIVLDTDGRNFDQPAGLGFPYDTAGGGDYSAAAGAAIGDGRFVSINVRLNTAGGFADFFVGPQINFGAGPQVIANPVVFLSSFGANHSGVVSPASTSYGQSFSFVPGAIFNSMESYNGRGFGGLGQNLNATQQQVADVLAAGATFAVGNVWEPFSLSVARNNQLVRNFLLSDMTWAEAAYSAIPALSWQQIVLGDPLARVVRVQEDMNLDGRMTVDDLYAWYAAPRDLNRDGVSNSADAAIIERSVRGFEAANMKHDQR